MFGLARSYVLPLALAAAVPACGGSPTYNWKAENALGYRVGPGDRLRLNVWKHEEVSQEVSVRPDGAFSLPLIGDVEATGRSVKDIAADVATRLNKYYADTPPVTAQVTEVKSYKIYIFGEVQRPGEFAPAQQVSVLMGLALAGGFTRFANPDRIIIVRKDARGERRMPFDFSAVVERGDLQQNLILQLGDTVVVP
ncbi:MAG: polysaccharide biosynthesis/export family protein [Myxococcales bacterium]